MSIIVPAILEQTKSEFFDQMSRVLGIPGAARIQVDFGDGVFIKNKMVEISEIPQLDPRIHWEAHLMVEAPEDFTEYQRAGFKTILLHYESFKSEQELHKAIKNIVELTMLPALVLNPETPVHVLKNFEAGIHHFQLMGIHPGFQGTPFLEETYARLAELRKLCPNAILEIDGGVNETNIKKIAETGADLLIAGSVLKKQQNISAEYEKLTSLVSVD